MSNPLAGPSDVATLDARVYTFYETASRSAGQPREWDRFRSLFLPGRTPYADSLHSR